MQADLHAAAEPAPRGPRRSSKPTASPSCACPGANCRGTWDVVLIGCGAEKAAEARPAAELYTGSLYRAHRRVLEHLGAWPPTAILSALHGWLAPDKVIEPYEHRLDPRARVAPWCADTWGDRIGARVWSLTKPAVLVLAGAAYVDPWLTIEEIGEEVAAARLVIDDPLRGLELGERLAFAADFAATKPDKKHPRCSFHAFLARWRASLGERRAARAEIRERDRWAEAAQVDMFGGTA